MSIQLYITRLKCLVRNKEAMFWCYLFPILLASCFFFAFNNLWKIEYFDTLPIAYVSEGEESESFEQVLEAAETSEGVKMFDIAYCDEVAAKQLLEKGDIEAYIVGSTKPELYVKGSGLNETIIKSYLDTYRQMSVTVTTILKSNPNAIEEGLIDDVMQHDTYIEAVKDDKKPAELLVYFYALLAFSCIFAANWGLDEVVNIQANLSGRGARVSVSSIPKMKLFLCNILAAFTAHFGSLILLFFYMYFIIKVDFGNNLLYLFAVCMVGSFAGLGMGAFIGVWVKKKAEVKEAILTIATLGGAFLSGMMMPDIKYMVATKFPLLSYINPVNLLTDSMYSLYYYDTYERYYTNTLLLGVIAIIFGILAIVGIRRKNYASI
jgi:ABC-2 type transport system permease protein